MTRAYDRRRGAKTSPRTKPASCAACPGCHRRLDFVHSLPILAKGPTPRCPATAMRCTRASEFSARSSPRQLAARAARGITSVDPIRASLGSIRPGVQASEPLPLRAGCDQALALVAVPLLFAFSSLPFHLCGPALARATRRSPSPAPGLVLVCLGGRMPTSRAPFFPCSIFS